MNFTKHPNPLLAQTWQVVEQTQETQQQQQKTTVCADPRTVQTFHNPAYPGALTRPASHSSQHNLVAVGDVADLMWILIAVIAAAHRICNGTINHLARVRVCV